MSLELVIFIVVCIAGAGMMLNSGVIAKYPKVLLFYRQYAGAMVSVVVRSSTGLTVTGYFIIDPSCPQDDIKARVLI